MSRHTLAVFLVLAIAQLFLIHQAEGVPAVVKGTCAQGAAAGADDSCDATAALMLTCEVTTCKAKIGGPCTASSSDECVTGAAACPAAAPLVCACPAKSKAKSDNTGCLAYVGETCSASQQCVANTETCTATVTTCACKTGYTASADKSACNGATGVMASLVLLVASFLTSKMM